MKENLLECLIRDERKVIISPGDSYVRLYKEFLCYFDSLQVITPHHVAIGAAFAYSWMPTILDLHDGDVQAVADILNRVKEGPISAEEVCCVAHMVNHSLVGASKLLHFVNPSVYAIWDSRVCIYLFGKSWQVQNYKNFQQYQDACQVVAKQAEFAPTHESINRKIGYSVTPIRAAEIIMYTCGLQTRM